MNSDKYLVKSAAGHDILTSVPGSKSITNRALLIAALCEGTTTLHGVLFSDDSRHFLKALIALGFPVTIQEEERIVTITGFGGRIPKETASVYVGSAGTAARFLSAFLGLSHGRYDMDASDQMKRRPMQELLEALEALGAQITYENEPYHFPFSIGNDQITSYEVTIDVDRSSQFLSALLITSVLFDRDLTIHVTGSHGMSYVTMTIAMMRQFGVTVESVDPTTFRIMADASYQPRDYQIEPDVSAAAYFYAMSPVLGVRSKVRNVHWDSLQGDTQFLHVLEKMGCTTREEEDGILMDPPSDGRLHGGSFDLSACSDQALTLAAIAGFADAPVTITGIGHIRLQECDRMHAITSNLAKLGIETTADENSVTITPSAMHGCQIETFEDHRVAMSFAIPGLVTAGVVIEDPMCCRKTFETYFEVLESDVCS